MKDESTPRYEYSRRSIRERIALLKGLDAPYGLTVRYAMKANPHRDIIMMMKKGGVHFDASSSYEAEELLKCGILGTHISLSSQQSPHSLSRLLKKGVLFVATSRKQLEIFIRTPGHPKNVGVRINPAMGSGHNNRTNTGGTNASFGIWHDYGLEILERAREAGVVIDRMHMHIGSGADPRVWEDVIVRALSITEQFPDVISLDIGGGFKVHRYGEEKETDMRSVMRIFAKHLRVFHKKTGRKLRLEIEPGTFFIAHAGTLVATIDDIVDTGSRGYTFLRLNTGMNDFLRSSIYGAQHTIEVINNARAKKEYVVVGHNCESGDLLTPAPGNPEEIRPRLLKEAKIGDEIRIYDVGAYCAAMSTKRYNAFPSANEVMVD